MSLSGRYTHLARFFGQLVCVISLSCSPLYSVQSYAFNLDDLIECLKKDSCLDDINVDPDKLDVDNLEIEFTLPSLPDLTSQAQLQPQLDLALNSYQTQLQTLQDTYTGQALDIATAKLNQQMQTLLNTQIHQVNQINSSQQQSFNGSQDEAIVTYEAQLLTAQAEEDKIQRKLKAAKIEANQTLASSLAQLRAFVTQSEQQLKDEYAKLVVQHQTQMQSILALSDVTRNLETDSSFDTAQRAIGTRLPSFSLGVFSDDKGQYAVPLQYAFNSWFSAGVTLPVQQKNADGMGRIGLFQRTNWLDFIELYAVQSFDDNQQYAAGLQVREKLSAWLIHLDWQQGQVSKTLDYSKLYASTGLGGRSSAILLGYHKMAYQREGLQSQLESDYYELTLQKQVRPFNSLPFPINLGFSLFSPENNQMQLNGNSSNINGEGWRVRLGLASRF